MTGISSMRKAICLTRSLPGRHARASRDCHSWGWLCSPVVLREPPDASKQAKVEGFRGDRRASFPFRRLSRPKTFFLGSVRGKENEQREKEMWV